MNIISVIKTVDMVVNIAAPIIDGVTKKLAPEMKDFADRLYTLSEKYPSLERWAEIVETGAEILTDILSVLGVDCDSANELGFKAEQAEKKISEFSSVEEYINYLRDEVELDKARFESLSDEEKMAYRTVGMAVEAEAISEKSGVKISPDFVLLMSKLKSVGEVVLEAAELVSLLKELKSNDIDNSQDVYEYFFGEGDSDRIKTGSVLKKIFTSLFNDKADDIIETIKMEERNK